MTTETIVAIGSLILANIGTTIGLFIWATTHAATATQNHRIETQSYRAETIAILKGIADEMKDFHARLCVIEERNSTKIFNPKD